jgi:exosortase
LLTVFAILMIHSTFLWSWGKWMAGREHYQFFPMILVGFCVLAWNRLAKTQFLPRPQFSVRVALYLSMSVFCFFIAVRTDSHWIGLISCLILLWTSVRYFLEATAADELRGPFLFLLIIVPPPLNLDLQCITGLQRVATWMASGGLDLCEIRHTVSGVAIRNAGKAYMVEEACSGIHSLFSALSAMFFYGVWCRYGIPRLVLTTAQTVGWVLIANAVRVFLIVFSDTRYQIPLDVGWRHDLLGMFTYCSLLLMALSTDRLLRFVFPLSDDSLPKARILVTISQSWNQFTKSILDTPSLQGRWSVIVPLVIVCVTLVPLAMLNAAQLFRTPLQSTSAGTAGYSGSLQDLREDSLPESLAGWERSGFRKSTRDASDPFGMTSSIWKFSGNGLTAEVSVDGYYSEWHDLAYCYTGTGWKLVSGENEWREKDSQRQPHTRLQLFRNSGSYAVVYFSCFDSRHSPVEPPEASGNLFRTLRNRLASGGLMVSPKQRAIPPVFQVQLMTESGQELLPHELASLEQLFTAFRSNVLNMLSAGQ